MIPLSEIKTQVLASYEKLKYTPRGNQEQICIQVLDTFLNKEKSNVVLGAPTGVGKSILGAVISDALDQLTPELPGKASIIAMGTLMLSQQYYDSFSSLDKYKVFQIQGASNYPCAFMESQPSATSKTAEECVFKQLIPFEQEKYCSGCEYNAAKKLVNKTDILITNYAYYLIGMLASSHLGERKLTVFDEAHDINNIFCNYTEIMLSVHNIDRYIKELTDTNGKCDNEVAALIMLKEKITSKTIDDGNYRDVLKIIQQLYSTIAGILYTQSKLLVGHDTVKAGKYDKMGRKYEGLGSKISDIFVNDYEHVFDSDVPNEVSVKTIFVGNMMDKLRTKYNLFMSGTISEQFVFDTLSLKKEETEFISIDPVFPIENKPIFFIGTETLNYAALKDPGVINTLQRQVETIVKFHEKDKGLIIVPSFYLGSSMIKNIKGTKIFEHRQGTKLVDVVAEFKRYNGPAVLVSPSIFEGVDFPNTITYQLIIKAPFASLGDKRIAHIARNYGNIYREMTLTKIVQGAGRGVRSETDKCSTYMLDKAIDKLYNSNLNIWKNQFKVMT